MHAAPLLAAQLPQAMPLHPADPGALLGHLRWCLHTPYAEALAVHAAGGLLGVATLVHFGTTARIGCFHTATPAAAELLLGALLQRPRADALLVQVRPRHAAWWQAHGFALADAFVTLAHGRFVQATHEEVALMEPAHTLALLRLDAEATGEDRRTLLLEHHYAAHAYVVRGAVQGALLPLLGHGLIVARTPAVGLELQRWLLPTQHRITVPEANTAALHHLEECGYDVASTHLRLVLGTAPPLRAHMVYAWPWM